MRSDKGRVGENPKTSKGSVGEVEEMPKVGGQKTRGGSQKESAAWETTEGERSLARGMGRRKVWLGGEKMLDLGSPWQRGY